MLQRGTWGFQTVPNREAAQQGEGRVAFPGGRGLSAPTPPTGAARMPREQPVKGGTGRRSQGESLLGTYSKLDIGYTLTSMTP